MDLTIDRLTKQFGSKIAVDRVSTRLTPGVMSRRSCSQSELTCGCSVMRPL